ncbi:DUF4331 domain-containing protein [Rhodococcus aerolatus]
MSSHREAPSISKDPTADNTDVYAFRSPDAPTTTTIVANFVPQQGPAAGPNFFEFDPSVTYYIYVDQTGDGVPDVTYSFNFTTNPTAAASQFFLYNTGTITYSGGTYTNYSVPQTYTVRRNGTTVASNVPVPPCNVGVHSTPNYGALAAPAVTALSGGGKVFAGQRADPFYADLGAIFDLADIRPIQFLHTGPLGPAFAKNNLRGLNVLSIVLQVPTSEIVAGGTVPRDGDVTAANAVVGIWSAAARPGSRVYTTNGAPVDSGAPVQVSRLGNPLFNEVLVPLTQKDAWNASTPAGDSAYAGGVASPGLASLLNVLYPRVFPNLAARSASGKPRADLLAILLTGLPAGIIPGLKTQIGNATTQADMLRLNVAVPVTPQPKPFGVLAGDLQGFPNGRRLGDDIVGIELRAIAGATLPLVEPDYKVDIAVNVLDDFAPNDNGPLLPSFPYLALPNSGFASDPSRYDSGS